MEVVVLASALSAFISLGGIYLQYYLHQDSLQYPSKVFQRYHEIDEHGHNFDIQYLDSENYEYRMSVPGKKTNASSNVFNEIHNDDNKYYYKLIVELENVTYGYTNLFIKRFDADFNFVGKQTYKVATNGINVIEEKSLLGTDGISIEHVGVMTESRTDLDIPSRCVIKKAYFNKKLYKRWIC